MQKFTFYNKISVLIFSILLSGFGGALMLGYNLRTIGKNKKVLPLVVWDSFLGEIASYKSKAIWIPLAVTILLYGGFYWLAILTQ